MKELPTAADSSGSNMVVILGDPDVEEEDIEVVEDTERELLQMNRRVSG